MGGDWFWHSMAVVISFVAVIAVLTMMIERDMRRSRGGGSVHANPMGVMDEVFHPAAHRASEELRHWDEIAATVPSPDGDDPSTRDGIQLLRWPDGTIRTARITQRR